MCEEMWGLCTRLAVGVVLSDVLEMPRVRWEEHRHVKELPREPVLHAPMNRLVADASEAHPRPHVDKREGDHARPKREEAPEGHTARARVSGRSWAVTGQWGPGGMKLWAAVRVCVRGLTRRPRSGERW